MLTIFDRREHARTALATVARKPVTALQPFGLSPDPHFIHRSDPYIWAFEQITTGVRQREGLILVTGEPGTGKTLLCRTLLSRLSDRHTISVVLDPCVRFEELLLQVLRDFGVLPDAPAAEGLRRHDLIAMLHRFLASLIPLNTTAVLVIDEAQHLHPEVLEQLRLLSNCESDRAKLLQIVLVGTPELDEFCRSAHMRHLDQRIARRCRLRPLHREEVVDYIESRLGAAGFAADEFSASAVHAVATLSGGVPRTINLLCERSMDIARRRGVSPIDLSVVRAAAMQLGVPLRRTWLMNRRTAVVAGALLVGLPPATWLCASQAMHVTHAASVSSDSRAADGRHAPVELASVTVARADVPLPKDDAVVGTLALADGFTIQVAAFRETNLATAVIQQLKAAGLPAFRRTDGSGLRHLIFVGPYVTDGEVQAAQQMLATQGFGQGRVTHEDAGALLP
jgi:general secretion pathway protein A